MSVDRARAVEREIARLEHVSDAMATALDIMPFGYVLVDASCRASVVNATARNLAAHGGPLTIEGNMLRCCDPISQQRLVEAITRAASAGTTGYSPGDAFSMPSSGVPSVRVVVLPVTPPSDPLMCDAPAAAIFLFRSQPQDEPPVNVLRSLFDLTAAEARVAALLVEGQTPTDVARALGVSIHTVRTHLKQVMGKTRTMRQADIVRLVAAAVPNLRLTPFE